MFRRLFSFGKTKRNRQLKEKENSLLLKNFSADSDLADISSMETHVVPLRSPEFEAALKKKKDSSELFNDAVNRLVEKLEGINNNLDLHVRQNEQLVQKMDSLPQLFSLLPETMERQQRLFDEMADRLRQGAAHDIRAIQELAGINEKLSVSAETDAQMTEHFGNVSRTLTKIDEDTLHQTEWIEHLNRSISTGEHLLRESLQKQHIRFYWLFGVSIAISLLAILGLAGVLIVLLRH